MKALIGTAALLLALAPAAAPAVDAPAPAGTVTVQLASGTETLYPFTTKKFPALVTDENDPVNLIFEGAADPREIRAALLSVNGDRTALGLPDQPPFNCTWFDAEGEEQATWTARSGWEGGAVQLACGGYDARIHLRLFRHGGRTLGGAHMDIQIPHTTEHRVVGWNFPAQFVTYDMIRSGLLNGEPYPTDVFGPAPSHRTIAYYIHNALPVELRALLGLPLEDVAPGAEVPIPSSGRAVVMDVRSSFVPAQSDTSYDLVIDYDMGGPKPFCNPDGSQWVWVKGPVRFTVRTHLTPSGRYDRTVLIRAILEVTPIDPSTWQPIGPTAEAFIFEDHRGILTDNYGEVTWTLGRTITDISQVLSEKFTAGQHDSYERIEECGTPAP